MDINKINTFVLDHCYSTLNSEKISYSNVTYSTFISSYLFTCNDDLVKKMKSSLVEIYDSITNRYTSVDCWFNRYLSDIKNIESSMLNDLTFPSTNEGSVNSYFSSYITPLSDDYNEIHSTIQLSAVVLPTISLGSLKTSVLTDVNPSSVFDASNLVSNKGFTTKIVTDDPNVVNKEAVEQVEEVVSFWGNVWEATVDLVLWLDYAASQTMNGGADALPTLESLDNNINSMIDTKNLTDMDDTVGEIGLDKDKITATVGSFLVSFVEGIMDAGEALLDVAAIVGNSYNQSQVLATPEMQKNFDVQNQAVKEFVEKERVTTLFDDYYENDIMGQWLKEHSYEFETVRAIGNSVGELGATVALSFVGIPAPIISGAIGWGKGSEQAFKEGATFDEGVIYGLANGTWNGLQFYAGGEIGKLSPFANEFFNVLSRVVLDGVDGALEGFVQPALTMIYQDGFVNAEGEFQAYSSDFLKAYQESFAAQGGWLNVLTNAAFGSIMSFLGEISGLADFALRNDSKVKVDADANVKLDAETSTSLKKGQEALSKDVGDSQKIVDNANQDIYDAIDESAITLANFKTDKGMFAEFRFKDVESLPDLNHPFWTTIENSDLVMLKIDGRIMTFDDAISYKKNYDFNKISAKNIANEQLEQVRSLSQKASLEKNVMESFERINERFDGAKRFNDVFELSMYFNDPKQYLFQKLKYLADNSPDFEYKMKLNEIMDYGKGYKIPGIEGRTPSSEINATEILEFLKSKGQLSPSEIDFISKINSSNKINYTKDELEKIFMFTAWSGPPLAAFNRGAKTNYNGKFLDGTNIEKIKNMLNLGVSVFNQLHNTNIPACDIDSFNKVMDSVVNKNVLKEDLIVYRGVEKIFVDGNELNISDLKPGVIFNDPAHTSASVIPTSVSHKHSYVLEILAPKGTPAAYLESFTGISSFNQQEILFGRNTQFKVLQFPIEDKITGQIKIKVEILPNKIDSALEASKFFPKIDSTNLSSNYKNSFSNVEGGIEADELILKMRENNLMSRFNSEVQDMYSKKLYDGPKPLAEHDYNHIKNVMLYSMYMGKELKLSASEFDMLIDCAKYHDIGLVNAKDHKGHAEISASIADYMLGGKYSDVELAKIKSIIEFHEVEDESLASLTSICNKYGIFDNDDIMQVQKIVNILRDADGLDLTRYPGQIDIDYFRNKEIAISIVNASHQIREHLAIESLKKYMDTLGYNELFYEINDLINFGYPPYVIDFASKYYDKLKFSSITEYVKFIMFNKKWTR